MLTLLNVNYYFVVIRAVYKWRPKMRIWLSKSNSKIVLHMNANGFGGIRKRLALHQEAEANRKLQNHLYGSLEITHRSSCQVTWNYNCITTYPLHWYQPAKFLYTEKQQTISSNGNTETASNSGSIIIMLCCYYSRKVLLYFNYKF